MRRATWQSRLVLLVLLLAGNASAQSRETDLETLQIRRDGTATVAPPPTPAPAKPTTQQSAAAAARAKPKSTGFDPARVAGALLAVVALIFLVRWVVKRFFGTAAAARSSRMVQVLFRSPLSPRQQLVLLRVGRRLLVVADGGGQMNTLSEITDPDEVAALLGQLQDDHADRATKSFGNLFGKLRGKFDEEDQATAREPREHQAAAADVWGEVDEEPAISRQPAAAAAAAAAADDPVVASTRRELNGLVDKVRMLARQFKSP